MKRPSAFGKRLRALREWVRMSPEELAEKSGVHPIAIRKYENGHTQACLLDTAIRLAAALGVSLERLTG